MAKSYRFGLSTTLSGAEYPALKEAWQAADANSFDLITFWDHYIPAFGDIDQANHEVWTLLAASAALTSNVRIVPSVLSATRHHPGLIANAVKTLDHISGGRIEIGLGAGGPPDEARRFGQSFPGNGERVTRLAESVKIIKLLFSEDRASFQGKYYSIDDAPLLPKPIQKPHPPFTIAGGGARTLKIVAEHAATWRSFLTPTPEAFAAKNKEVTAACEKAGRDPETLERADAVNVPADWWESDPAAGVAALQASADAGVNCFIMVTRVPTSSKGIEFFGKNIIPAFRSRVGA